MNGVFIVGMAEIDCGECIPAEIGSYCVRENGRIVLVCKRRADADRIWAARARHLGYTYN